MGKRKVTYEEFSKRFNDVQKGKLELLSEKKSGYVDTQHTVKVHCPIHGDIEGYAYNFLRGKGCKECAKESRKMSYEEFSKRFNNVWKGKLELLSEEKSEYAGCDENVKVHCPIHGDIEGYAYGFLHGHGCKKCADERLRLTYKEYSKRFNEVWKGKLELLSEEESEYAGYNKNIKVNCPKHGIIEGRADGFLNGYGCKECYNESQRLTYKEFSKRFNDVQKGRLELIPETELDYKDTKSIIRVNCPEHGIIKGLAKNYLQGQGCHICIQSEGEKLVRELLEANNIKFEQFYCGFDWLRFNPKSKQYLEFLLTDYNIAIEVQDCKQHICDEQYIERDENKLKLCKEHGITLLYFSIADLDFPYYVIKDTQELINKIKENKYE